MHITDMGTTVITPYMNEYLKYCIWVFILAIFYKKRFIINYIHYIYVEKAEKKRKEESNPII